MSDSNPCADVDLPGYADSDGTECPGCKAYIVSGYANRPPDMCGHCGWKITEGKWRQDGSGQWYVHPYCRGQFCAPLSVCDTCEDHDNSVLSECDTCGAAYCRFCDTEQLCGPPLGSRT